MNDWVATLSSVLRDIGVSRTDQQRVVTRMQEQLGGQRVYVPKGTTEGKVQRLATALAGGIPLREAFEVAGMSRRAGYRHLARRRGRKLCHFLP